MRTIILFVELKTSNQGIEYPLPCLELCFQEISKIKKSKLRGVKSEGMMCSARELNLGEDHSGLLVLSEKPELGTPINEVFPEGETVFDLAVTPNRPDALSVIGLARELAALFGLKMKKA